MRVKAPGAVAVEITARVEQEPVNARREWIVLLHQVCKPAIRVGLAAADRVPRTFSCISIQYHRHTGGRAATRDVQDMSRNSADVHCKSLNRRMWRKDAREINCPIGRP